MASSCPPLVPLSPLLRSPECETQVGLVSTLGVRSLQALAPLVGACAGTSPGLQQLADILASLPQERSMPRALALQDLPGSDTEVWEAGAGAGLDAPSGLGAALATAMRHHDRGAGRRRAESAQGRPLYAAVDVRMRGTGEGGCDGVASRGGREPRHGACTCVEALVCIPIR